RYLAPPAQQPRASSRAHDWELVREWKSFLVALLEFFEFDRAEPDGAMAEPHATQQASAYEAPQLAHGDRQLRRRFLVSQQAAVHAGCSDASRRLNSWSINHSSSWLKLRLSSSASRSPFCRIVGGKVTLIGLRFSEPL